jgi:hypothetical protein
MRESSLHFATNPAWLVKNRIKIKDGSGEGGRYRNFTALSNAFKTRNGQVLCSKLYKIK